MTKTTVTHTDTVFICDQCGARYGEFSLRYNTEAMIELNPTDESDTEPTIDLCYDCTQKLEEVLKWKQLDLILKRYRDQYDLEVEGSL